jgi:hypothetical protein
MATLKNLRIASIREDSNRMPPGCMTNVLLLRYTVHSNILQNKK